LPGCNVDDLAITARRIIRRHNACSPLIEARLTRAIASSHRAAAADVGQAGHGLPLAHVHAARPSPSRRWTASKRRGVSAVAARQLRVRHHGDVARSVRRPTCGSCRTARRDRRAAEAARLQYTCARSGRLPPGA
jgi:hypothetical protein